MDNETYKLLEQDVRAAARVTGREWADVIDADDAEQEIWVRLLDAGVKTWSEIAGLEKPARVSVLNSIGHQIAMQHRDDYELFSGNYVYGTDQVRKLLGKGDFIDIETFDNASDLSFTERTDLISALERLKKRNAAYVNVIGRAFVAGDELDSTERKNLTRAVDALTHEMNRTNKARRAEYSEGPGTRKVTSNAQASFRTGE